MLVRHIAGGPIMAVCRVLETDPAVYTQWFDARGLFHCEPFRNDMLCEVEQNSR